MNRSATYKGVIFNILFAVYAFFLQAPLARKIAAINETDAPWVSMAIILFVASILEGVYLPYKIKDAFTRIESDLSPNSILIIFMPALIFRMLIGMGIAAVVFHFITPEILHKSALTPVGAIIALLLVLKELVVLFIALAVMFHGTARTCPKWVSWTGDGVLLVYSCVSFTILSQPGVFFTASHAKEMLPLIFVCFLAFLQSLRMGFFVEEYARTKTRWDRIAIWGSLLLAAVAATRAFV